MAFKDERLCRTRMDPMGNSIECKISDIQAAYRLLLYSKLAEARKNNNSAAEEAAMNELQKDSAEIGSSPQTDKSSKAIQEPAKTDQNIEISLSELFAKLKEISCQRAQEVQQTQETHEIQSSQAQNVNVKQTIAAEASFTFVELEKIDGLVLKNKNLAETDRYKFEFQGGSTFKILDKWSNRSTTIWGDPHVDTSDEEGANDGDFKDLTASNRQTTFMLQDDTRITFTAFDNGLIENVDIFKGSQHLSGTGSASKSWSESNQLFAGKVDTHAIQASSAVPLGDVVYAGGDGNDWYDAGKTLIWGKTTGFAVTSRPSGYYEFQYTQSVTQEISAVQVNQQA